MAQENLRNALRSDHTYSPSPGKKEALRAPPHDDDESTDNYEVCPYATFRLVLLKEVAGTPICKF